MSGLVEVSNAVVQEGYIEPTLNCIQHCVEAFGWRDLRVAPVIIETSHQGLLAFMEREGILFARRDNP